MNSRPDESSSEPAERAGTAPVSFGDVEAARNAVRDYIYQTPCAHSATLSTLCGNKVYLKLENLQMTGSYKERGSLNCILQLSEADRRAGVIASSAGNHAQGVAYHASRLGVDATIVMPLYTPLNKVTSTQRYGARVILHGESYDDAYDEACRIAEKEGRAFIHPFNDPAVIAGQGTVGLELLEQNPYLDAVVVPIGGGGLIAGMAVAIKETNPRIKVFGVEAAAMPGMRESLAAGRVVEVPARRTMADGIAVRRVGENTFKLIERYVDDIVTVEEEEIASAVLTLLEVEKTMVEGAGASPLAALVNGRLPLSGKKVALVCTGGNIDVTVLSRIIERGLVKDGRMGRFVVTCSDSPGMLAVLTGIVADQQGNVIEITHNRAFASTMLGQTQVSLTLETKGPEHIKEIVAAIAAAGLEVRVG